MPVSSKIPQGGIELTEKNSQPIGNPRPPTGRPILALIIIPFGLVGRGASMRIVRTHIILIMAELDTDRKLGWFRLTKIYESKTGRR